MRIAVLSPMTAETVLSRLPDDLSAEAVLPDERSLPAAREALAGADLVIGDYAHEIEIADELLAAMDRARLIHQPSTGYENIDLDACARHGIPVTNAGSSGSPAMAEHTVMTILALLKSLVWCDAEMRRGGWPQQEALQRSLVDLEGRTVGIIGMGGAGQATASRLAPFDCRVLYTARRRRPAALERELGVAWAALEQLLAEADVICLLADLNASTAGLIDAAALETMGAGSFLVNPSRGGLVDEAALVEALRERRIAGAALDVFADEPLPADSPLRELDNVILTPHLAGGTRETLRKSLRRMVEVITAVGRGELPDGVLNGVDALRSVD